MKRFIFCIPILAATCVCRASIEAPTLGEYPHLGRYYARTGQHERAVSTYRAMIARTPDTREAEEGWLELGACHLELMNSARADLAKAKAAGAPKAEIEQIQGRTISSMNQALAAYRAVAAQFPASRAEAIIGAGNLYAAFGPEKRDEALHEYARVIADFPEEAGRAQVLIGDLRAACGEPEAAKAAYREAISWFPEVASLATLRYADLLFAEGSYAAAADNYAALVGGTGVDGAYDHKFHQLGDVMERAIVRRGDAERALGNRVGEFTSYADASTRYYGSRAEIAAAMKSAEALDYYGKGDEATAALESIVSRYPKSVWAARAQMRLAEMRAGTSRAAELYKKTADAHLQSIFWVEAQMRLAETYWAISDRAEEAELKQQTRAKARATCEEIIARYPSCPEAAKAREFLSSHPLQ